MPKQHHQSFDDGMGNTKVAQAEKASDANI